MKHTTMITLSFCEFFEGKEVCENIMKEEVISDIEQVLDTRLTNPQVDLLFYGFTSEISPNAQDVFIKIVAEVSAKELEGRDSIF